MTKIRTTYDTRDAQVELDRLEKGFDIETRKRMDAHFQILFQETQKRVHVETGSLKASGRRYTRDSRLGFRGTITYGGYSPGKKNPVLYARIENEREGVRKGPPGTPHKFFYGIEDAFDAIEQDVADWLTNSGKNKRRSKFKTKGSRRRR
jgi:hypothetical protein